MSGRYSFKYEWTKVGRAGVIERWLCKEYEVTPHTQGFSTQDWRIYDSAAGDMVCNGNGPMHFKTLDEAREYVETLLDQEKE
mgnify:CR=1 FL=1